MDGEAVQAWSVDTLPDAKLEPDQPVTSQQRHVDTSSIVDARQVKATTVLHACRSHDLDTLITLATTEHGLGDDEVRRTACTCCGPIRKLDETLILHSPGPILLGYSRDKGNPTETTDGWQKLPRHKDEDQVALDVDRSFIYYPKSK